MSRIKFEELSPFAELFEALQQESRRTGVSSCLPTLNPKRAEAETKVYVAVSNLRFDYESMYTDARVSGFTKDSVEKLQGALDHAAAVISKHTPRPDSDKAVRQQALDSIQQVKSRLSTDEKISRLASDCQNTYVEVAFRSGEVTSADFVSITYEDPRTGRDVTRLFGGPEGMPGSLVLMGSPKKEKRPKVNVKRMAQQLAEVAEKRRKALQSPDDHGIARGTTAAALVATHRAALAPTATTVSPVVSEDTRVAIPVSAKP